MQACSSHFPDLGFGLGLRIPHYSHIFEHWPQVDWFEVIKSLEDLFGFEEASYFVIFFWLAVCGAGKASVDYVIGKRLI